MTHWDESPRWPHREEPLAPVPIGWTDEYGDPHNHTPGSQPTRGRHAAPDDAARDDAGFRERHSDPRGIRPISPMPPPQSPARPYQGGPRRPVSPAGFTPPLRHPYPHQPAPGPPDRAHQCSPVRAHRCTRAPAHRCSRDPDRPGNRDRAHHTGRCPAPAQLADDGPIGSTSGAWITAADSIIDADEVDPEERKDSSRFNRRMALLGFGGVVGSAAFALAPQGLDLGRKLFGGPAEALSHDTLPGDGSPRPAGQQASKARTYAEQDDSYMGSTDGDKVRKNTPQTGKTKTGPAAAANAPKPVAVSALGTDPIRHLASRVTFGATPKLLADIKRIGIDAWLGWQLEPDKIPLTRAELKLAELTTLTKSIDQLRAEREANDKANIRPEQETVEATIARQIWSDRQVYEVMVDFWNDFLHVGAFFDGAEIQRASFDRDVIRKYALDNYPDMFVAANRHPALMNYLDQNQSTKNAVNENLARENLELYSVGVDGGYTEKDVRQAALLQTGRSIRDDKYIYRADQHYVGPVADHGLHAPECHG